MTQPASLESFGSDIDRAIRRSVETIDSTDLVGVGDRYGVLAFAAAFADAVPSWGVSPSVRDSMLRQFITKEPFAGSAFGSIIARNAAFSWEIRGPERTQQIGHELLLNANWGGGWVEFISLLSMDYLTQDKGAFIELIREADSERAPVVGLRNLDAAMCWSTGNPLQPVIFLDRVSGKYHRLKWYQVRQLRELPMFTGNFTGTFGRYHGMQLCALSRALKGAQIWFNVEQYQQEKTGGRHTRAIHVISGVQKADVEDAMKLQQANADGQLLERYIQPVILAAVDPDAKPSVATLELAGLPDAFNQQEGLKQYLTLLAMALLTDYGELAPLPGGQLGSGMQSEIMDDKSKKKGAGLFRKIITHVMNTVILPDNLEFAYDEQDMGEEEAEATVKKLRAEARALMVQTGEVDRAGARQMALDDGDISPELFEQMNAKDLTGGAFADTQRYIVQIGGGPGAETPGGPLGSPGNIIGTPLTGKPTQTVAPAPEPAPTGDQAQATKASDPIAEERLATEADAQAAIEKPLKRIYANISKRLTELE